MASSHSMEDIVSSVASLNRGQVKKHLMNFKGRFKLDFSETYLNGLSVDRLKHILLAAIMTKKKKDLSRR